MNVYIVRGAGLAIRGAFDTLDGAKELAKDLALDEYRGGNTASHFTVEGWNGETKLGVMFHAYGYDEAKRAAL